MGAYIIGPSPFPACLAAGEIKGILNTTGSWGLIRSGNTGAEIIRIGQSSSNDSQFRMYSDASVQSVALNGVGTTSTGGFALGNFTLGTGTAPDASAKLQIVSTTRGVLLPVMTTAQKNAIGSPATGLLVYDSDLNKLYVYNGGSWAVAPG